MLESYERAVVVQASQGDMAAFEVLVRLYQGRAVGYAGSILRDMHASEDAAQEAFVSAWLSLPDLRDPAAFGGWLRRLVFTQCNRQQRRKDLPTVDLGSVGDTLAAPEMLPDTALEHRERRQALLEAVDGLTPALKETVLLYYFGEHSASEIAAFLEVSTSTVGKRLHDARARLKGRVARMEREAASAGFTRRVIDRVVSIPFDSTILSTVVPTLQAAGIPCSWPRAAGVLGHAFTFSMHEGCGSCCWHGNIDWWLFFDRVEALGLSFKQFQAIQGNPRIQPVSVAALQRLKEQTWMSVRASVDRGVPAIAWGPMTKAQQDDGPAGHDFLVWENRYRRNLINWALLVGYDERVKHYVVRHPVRNNDEYEVPFDGFGTLDPVSWYCVLVPDAAIPVDREHVARQSLVDAVRFAEGTRYNPDEAAYAVEAEGLAAYERWQKEVAAGTASVQHAAGFAWLLKALRTSAADYLKEVVADLPQQTHEALGRAEEAYREELSEIEGFVVVCEAAGAAGAWNVAAQRDVAAGISEALRCEREAIEAIREATAQLETEERA